MDKNELQPYKIIFKIEENQYAWIRYYPDIDSAKRNANKILNEEFGDNFKLVSVTRFPSE